MSMAHAPVDAPVVIACPEKRYADGRDVFVYDDRVEIVFFQNKRAANGLTVKDSIACVVLTREVYQQLLCEVAPQALAALAASARCKAMN